MIADEWLALGDFFDESKPDEFFVLVENQSSINRAACPQSCPESTVLAVGVHQSDRVSVHSFPGSVQFGKENFRISVRVVDGIY